jgi:DNA-binding GntR family transcriptional regulator
MKQRLTVPQLYPLRRPRSLTERAADAIRERIVSGDVQLGEALSEITLAAELGVSKTPVREAFLQLKNEGLVDIQPQRGTFVFQMTSEQVRQLSVLRELLEVESLRIAMRGEARLRLADNLMDVIARMVKAIAADDFRLYRTLDNELHQHIIIASGNQFIQAAYSSIAFRVQALRNRLCIELTQNARSLREHQDIAALVSSNDAEGAPAKLRDHIGTTMREHIILVEDPARR